MNERTNIEVFDGDVNPKKKCHKGGEGRGLRIERAPLSSAAAAAAGRSRMRRESRRMGRAVATRYCRYHA